jgi:hypothetical protein
MAQRKYRRSSRDEIAREGQQGSRQDAFSLPAVHRGDGSVASYGVTTTFLHNREG